MPFTRDLKPLIGKLPHHPNAYLLTGLSSSGFEKGPMAGKLLAEYMHSGVGDAVLREAEPLGKVGV